MTLHHFTNLSLLAIFLVFSACSPSQYIQKANKQYSYGNYEQARHLYGKVLVRERRNTAALWGIARVCYHQKDYKGAIYHLNDLLSATPRTGAAACLYDEEVFLLAESYFQIDEYVKAFEQYRLIIDYCKNAPQRSKALFKAGECAFILGVKDFNDSRYASSIQQLTLADEYFKQQNQSFRQQETLLYALAKSYLQTNQFEKAINQYKRQLTSFPSGSYSEKAGKELGLSHYNQAITLRKSNSDCATVLSHLEQAARRDADLGSRTEGLFVKASCLTRTGKYQEALALFGKLQNAPGISPNLLKQEIGLCKFQYAKIIYTSGDLNQALPLFQAARDALTGGGSTDRNMLAETYHYAGLIYQAKGRRLDALQQFDQVCRSYSSASCYRQSCRSAMDLALKLDRLDDAIRYTSALQRLERSDAYTYQLAVLHGRKNQPRQSLQYLLQLYDSPGYASYRSRARTDRQAFTCLAGDERFFRWLTGYRRVKLQVKEAFCDDTDAMSGNDLFVIVNWSDWVLLCTDIVLDNNHAVFSGDYVIFDYPVGEQVRFVLMDEDDFSPNDLYLNQQSVLRRGDHTLSQGRYWVKYSVADTDEGVYTTNTRIPPNLTWGEIISGLSLAAATISTLSGYTEGSRFFDCLTQAGIGQQVDNPLAAAIISEAAVSVARKRKISLSKVGQETAVNWIVTELKSNGHSNLAMAVESGNFLRCIFSE